VGQALAAGTALAVVAAASAPDHPFGAPVATTTRIVVHPHRPMSALDSTPPPTCETDLRDALLDLRGSLTNLYVGIEAPPQRPQEVARRFRLDKNLTWKVSKLLGGGDPLESATHLPGKAAFEILLKALQKGGAGPDLIEPARASIARLDDTIERHSGDRATLELLLDGLRASGGLEVSRRLAFRGNSGIWGLQARGRFMLHVLAPNAEHSDRLDLVIVAALVGVLRLRPIDRWPIFQFQRYGDNGGGTPWPRRPEPIEPPASPDAPLWLMQRWSSPDLALHSSIENGVVRHELAPAPVGRTGESTICFGLVERAAVPRYTSEPGAYGEAAASMTLPIEQFQFDFLVHRDLPEAAAPEALVIGRLFNSVLSTEQERAHHRLPIDEVPLPLAADPAASITPHWPDYAPMVERVFDRVGWSRRDFVGVRLSIAHPPIPSQAVLRYRLPPPPP